MEKKLIIEILLILFIFFAVFGFLNTVIAMYNFYF